MISKVLEALFDQALDLEGTERAAFIAAVEPKLRDALIELLVAAEEPNVVDESPAALAGKLLFEKNAIRAGQSLGAYTLLRLLGEGGMASVWLAERSDGQFDQRVAIKCLKNGLATPEIRARFIQEQHILAKLEHPRIARMYDAGVSAEGVPFIVMEWVREGLSLVRYCNEKRLNLEQRLSLFEKICQAVSYAHSNLIVHRDLKPGNILVGEEGEPKLLDFGIAKLLHEQSGAVTRTGLRMLTPEYAAPEQYQGGVITTATDVYALGIVLYELLSGLRPQVFDKNRNDVTHRTLSPSEALRRLDKTTRQSKTQSAKGLAEERATSIEHLQRSLKGDLDVIIMKALQYEPERRYASVSAFSDDLRRYRTKQPISARKDTWPYRTRKFIRRNVYAVAVGVITVGLLLFATVFSLKQARYAQAEADRARVEAQRATAVKRFLTDLLEVSDAGIPRDQVPSTETLLEDGGKRIEQEFNDTPELKLDLLLLLGRVYSNLGLYQKAEPLLKQALVIANKNLSPKSETWLAAQIAWANWLNSQSQIQQAHDHIETALHEYERSAPKPSPVFAEALLCYAGNLSLLTKLQQSLDTIRRAIQILRISGNEEHLLMDRAQRQLANALIDFGGLEEAEPILREQEIKAARRYGKNHAKYAQSLVHLAKAFQTQARFKEAIALVKQAIAIYESVFFKPNRQLIGSYSFLAKLHYDQNEYAEAESIYTKVFSIQNSNEQLQSKDGGIDAAESIRFIADVQMRQGKYAEAEDTLKKAEVLTEKYYGTQYSERARLYRIKSLLYRKLGRFSEGLAASQESLRILQLAPKAQADALQISYSLLDLAMSEYGFGVGEGHVNYLHRSLSHLNEGMAIALKLLPAHNRNILLGRDAKASLYLKLGETQNAWLELIAISPFIGPQSQMHPEATMGYWDKMAHLQWQQDDKLGAIASMRRVKETLERMGVFGNSISEVDRAIDEMKRGVFKADTSLKHKKND